MNYLLSLSKNDLLNTYRDPIFKAILFFPFLSFAILKWGYPYFITTFELSNEYAKIVLMWGCLQSALMFGFIYGFLFLEEKEENIFAVLQILPLKMSTLLFGRLLTGMVVSSLVNYLMIAFGGIIETGVVESILLSVEFSLASPFLAIVLALLAQNRIEGMAVMKVVNLLMIIPAIVYFFDHPLFLATALIPTYWMFKSLEYVGQSSFVLYLSIGFIYTSGCIVLAASLLKKGFKYYTEV